MARVRYMEEKRIETISLEHTKLVPQQTWDDVRSRWGWEDGTYYRLNPVRHPKDMGMPVIVWVASVSHRGNNNAP